MNVLGIMSGTSLDGLDFAICSFDEKGGNWSYRIHFTETMPYSSEWLNKLAMAPRLTGLELLLLNADYGDFIAQKTREITDSSQVKPDLIASHGHTVFHQPGIGFTFQLGDPQVIASRTGIPVVGNFRQADVLLGGQGAPLVPVGDEYLFPDYDYCLNLGGFANISWKMGTQRLARDICPANIVLNRYAAELGLACDNEGKAARSGDINHQLLNKLNSLPYYQEEGPGSLAREWLESEFLPLVHEMTLSVTDILRTLVEHISRQVANKIRPHSNVLTTGGGAYNEFLLERIALNTQSEIAARDNLLIEFKEALVFGFLGLLRYRDEINCFSSVTGARQDSSCGILYLP